MKDSDIWWSVDEENYNYSSLEELLDAEWDQFEYLKEGSVVYYGEIKLPSTSFIDADDIVEMISERAYEDGGEYADNYPNCSDEDLKELSDFIIAWQAKFTPRFFTIKKSKEYTLTKEDIASFQED
jgi:hypothetical protein